MIERDKRPLRLKSLTVKWVMIATRLACQKSMDWRERFQKFARNFLVTSAHALKWGLVLDKESINTVPDKAWQWGQLHMEMAFFLVSMQSWISTVKGMNIMNLRMFLFNSPSILANRSPHIVWRLINGYKRPKILDSGQRFAFPQEYFFSLPFEYGLPSAIDS